MRKLLPLLLLFAFGVPQAATLDKRPRKKRAKAQTAETAPAAAPAPAADAGATAPRPETAADAPRYNDRLAVDLSPVQIDSLLAV